MQKNEPLTFFEGFSILCIVFLFHIFNEILPITKHAGTASWMARGVSAVVAFGLLLLFYQLAKRHEGKDIHQILEELFGKAIGRVLQVCLLAYYFLFIVINLCETLRLLIDYSYPESGLMLMNVVIMGVVAVAALYSFKGLGKIASLLTPLFLVCLAFILFFGNNQYDIHLLAPIWGYGIAETGRVGLLLVSNFDAFLIALCFLGSFSEPKAFRRSAGWAVAVAGVSFVLTSLCVNMAFPYELAEDGTFGLLELAHNIYINRYFQRFESLFIALLAMSLIMVMSTGFFALKKTYCHLFAIDTQHSNAVVLPLAALVVSVLMYVRHEDDLYYYLRLFIETGGVFVMFALALLCLLVDRLRRRGRMLRLSCLLLIPCLLGGVFTGCLHYREPDEVAYAIVMGYDKGTTEQYTVTLKLLGESGDSTSRDDSEDNLFVTEAPSAFTALSMINTVMPKQVSLLHVEMIVISEELAREGVDGLIAPVTRYKETKSSIALVITRCSAREFISTPQSLSTPLPMNTELFVQPYKQVGAYKPMTIAQVYNTYTSNYGDAIAMYGSIKQETDTAQEEAEAQAGEDSGPAGENKTGGAASTGGGNKTGGAQPGGGGEDDSSGMKGFDHADDPVVVNPDVNYFTGFMPGELPASSAIEMQIGGMAVFSHAKMVGALNTMESAVFMIVEGSYHNANYAVKDPYRPEDCYVVFRLRSRRPTEVNVDILEDGTPVINLGIYLKGQILISQNTEVDYTEVEHQKALEQYCEEWVKTQADDLIQRTQEEFGADIWHLGRNAAMHFATIPEWEAYDWRSRYPDAIINTTVDFEL